MAPVLSVLALAGCGDEVREDRIVATTGIAADMTRSVAGPGVEVVQLIPDGAEPHTFSLSAKERAELESASLLVGFGGGLEEGLPLDAAERRFEFADALGLGPGDDPHVWMDPRLVAGVVPDLVEAVVGLDVGDPAEIRSRGRAYERELLELDREISASLSGVPRSNRVLISSHEVLSRFGERYGFDPVKSLHGSAPEAEVSAKRLQEMVSLTERLGAPAVFAAQGEDGDLMGRLADLSGAELVDDLLLEGFGEQAGSYPELMRYSAGRIAEALR